jgi:hypothetical protein
MSNVALVEIYALVERALAIVNPTFLIVQMNVMAQLWRIVLVHVVDRLPLMVAELVLVV